MASHLQCPPMHATSSLRSRSSGSSTSSLSSTFSDMASSSSSVHSEGNPNSNANSNSKTNAFFASPFSTHPPSPTPPTPPPAPPPKPRSLTEEFFSTPARPPSPPASSISMNANANAGGSWSSKQTPSAVHPSRIFPSRYTSHLRRSPDSQFITLDNVAENDPSARFAPYHTHSHRGHGHDRDSSAYSSYSSSSDASSTCSSTTSPSFVEPRLPTPPPSASISRRSLHRDDTITPIEFTPPHFSNLSNKDKEEGFDMGAEEATPRPADLEPNLPLLHFERSLLLSRQDRDQDAKAAASASPPRSAGPEMARDHDEGGDEEEEPHEGSIIELPSLDRPYPYSSSSSSHSHYTPSSSILPLPLSPLSLTLSIASQAPEAASSSNRGIDRGTPTPTNEFASSSSGSGSAFDPSFASGTTPAFTTSPESTQPPAPLPLPLPPTTTSTTFTSPDLIHPHTSPHAPTPTQPDPEPPRIRLLKTLGHGAFSAVWLAEDLSRVPLTLVAKKSVRDLRRRVSGRDREGDKRRERKERKEREDRENVRDEERNEVGTTSTPRQDVPIQMKEGKVGDMETEIETTPTPVTPIRRPPNRLREGLRNMLSFSRASSSSSTNTPTPTPSAIAAAAIPAMPSPISPSPALGLGSGDSGFGGSVNEDGTLSRHSSIKSLPSVASEHSRSSVSRNSSVRSSTSTSTSTSRGPSRNSSLRLALHPHYSEDGAEDANVNANGTIPEEATTLSRDSSLKKFRARVRGTKPASRLGRAYLDERDGEMGEPVTLASDAADAPSGVSSRPGSRPGSSSGLNDLTSGGFGGRLSRNSSLGSASARHSSSGGVWGTGRLVAVKMTPRKPRVHHANMGTGARQPSAKERMKEREEEERTRVGFVREVEVLKHISHPNITPLLAHLSTSTHHILVLPYLPGGDLLGLVNNDVAWGKLGESVLRRIWCELCKAVGWMHGVGLVHRDIKLENILLTTPTFLSLTPTSPRPTVASLPTPPAPLIKLTDFGLSRFVELTPTGEAELLTTRCGSEAYAAPELVTGASGGYDARRTDAWACGVVLYALVGRRLPFGEGEGGGEGQGQGGQGKIGGERASGEGKGRAYTSMAERRHWLMRIARGEWEWPGDSATLDSEPQEDGDELVGPQLVKSQGAKRIVSRLLVRDPRKRARIVDLWDDAWMQGGFSGQEVIAGSADPGVDGAGDKDKDVVMRSPGDFERREDGVEELSASASPSTTARSYDMLQDEDEIRFYHQPTAMGTEYFPDGQAYISQRPASEGAPGEWDAEEGEGEEGEEEFQDAEEGLEEEEEEEEEGGCLFDHEGIDSITRQEVV